MSNSVRVRFAPSPTGPLHIGGVRTALFNYLFAKKHGGTFLLRIEDTDQNRYVEGAEQYIIDALNWCGIPYDEGPGKEAGYGPYRQSERRDLYQQYAAQLIASGHAYYAFDTPEDLQALRKDYESRGDTFVYNWHNRDSLDNSLSLSPEEVSTRITTGAAYVVRFKSPKDETLTLQDAIRGTISIDTNVLDDKVLFKSDGMPTYHLANIVDDHLMDISHVIRGEEWLPSLPLHHLLYEALGWQAPQFAHLPLIMKPVGKGKLSKRDGDNMGVPVFPLDWNDPESNSIIPGFREAGYFAEALINFLAFLGWNPGTEQEIFDLNNLVSEFDLVRVQKGGARFDPDKIKWFNHHYMQTADLDALADTFIKNTPQVSGFDQEYVLQCVGLIRERATFVRDFWDLSHYFFMAPDSYAEKAAKKAFKPETEGVLTDVKNLIKAVQNFSAEQVQSVVKGWITEREIGFGKVMMPLRLALVGDLKGPDVFTIIAMIGKAETLGRLDRAIAAIPKN